MRTASKIWVMLMVMAVLPLLSGCVVVLAGAASAGTVAWVEGRLDSPLDANFDRAEQAVNRAVEQLKFVKVNEKKDALNAILIVRTAEDKRVEIKVIRVGDMTSRVQIRVGVFGDKGQSLAILDRIKGDL
jgi:ABC-type Na+ efflux pump permease subunit